MPALLKREPFAAVPAGTVGRRDGEEEPQMNADEERGADSPVRR